MRKLALRNFPLGGFYWCIFDRFQISRIFQLRSERNDRNARYPMKTNVKTHRNLWTSVEIQGILIFLRKSPTKLENNYHEIHALFEILQT